MTLLADFIGLGELLAKFNMGSTRNYRWLVVLMTVPGQGVRAAPRHVTGDCEIVTINNYVMSRRLGSVSHQQPRAARPH